ncbi:MULTISPECIES: hypothetical protein [unclassified Streptomyces]|uniref:hypothetical protein n=1 Tax=unclassified Streptomyces TaxID=2593676 RepID=UPI002E77A015|nr:MULTISPECIES: hypothetical protein [unclassified Streptomyces]MEE1758146.1 hypothetical protein [Streptomyces sp. SP18BB07]MEE1832282.1 hypothetical protein [Streptomyces sp. SP17KL33]
MNHPTSGTGPDTAAQPATGAGEAGVGGGAGTPGRTGARLAPDREDTGGTGDMGDAGETGRRLRAAFAEAAYGLTPPPVPLEAIEREGRSRRRLRRAAALSTGCGLLLLPLVTVLALRPDGSSTTVQPMAPPDPRPSASASSTPTRLTTPGAGQVRVVAPGEKLHIGDGTRMWLTEEGKYGDTPGVSEVPEFRSVVDGNLDTSTPGASVQETARGPEQSFLTGLYYGGRTVAAGVRIELYDGRTLDGTVVRLAGNEEWGGWYVLADVEEGVSNPGHMRGITRKVTVYDKDGGVVASLDLG